MSEAKITIVLSVEHHSNRRLIVSQDDRTHSAEWPSIARGIEEIIHRTGATHVRSGRHWFANYPHDISGDDHLRLERMLRTRFTYDVHVEVELTKTKAKESPMSRTNKPSPPDLTVEDPNVLPDFPLDEDGRPGRASARWKDEEVEAAVRWHQLLPPEHLPPNYPIEGLKVSDLETKDKRNELIGRKLGRSPTEVWDVITHNCEGCDSFTCKYGGRFDLNKMDDESRVARKKWLRNRRKKTSVVDVKKSRITNKHLVAMLKQQQDLVLGLYDQLSLSRPKLKSVEELFDELGRLN